MLLAEVSGPPKCRLGKVNSPCDIVLSSRNGDPIFCDNVAVYQGLDPRCATPIAVEPRIEPEMGALNRCVLAENEK
jgi:hypothetical protein